MINGIKTSRIKQLLLEKKWQIMRSVVWDYLPDYHDPYTIKAMKESLKSILKSLIKGTPREKLHKIPQRGTQAEKAVEQWYEYITGQKINLTDPKTFNEKINWLKVYDSTPQKGRLADKYLVYDWASRYLQDEQLIPLLGVWDKPEDIDFEQLPNRFVLKITNGSGYIVFIDNKESIDKKKLFWDLRYWQRFDFAASCYEYHYRYCMPRIIAQPYITALTDKESTEYKVHCFRDSECIIWAERNILGEHNRHDVVIGEEREPSSPQKAKTGFYDEQWNYLFKQKDYDRLDCPAPRNLKKMIELSKKLTHDFVYARVDWYEVEGKLVFGEITFTHNAGLDVFDLEQAQYDLGERVDLTQLKAWNKCHSN